MSAPEPTFTSPVARFSSWLDEAIAAGDVDTDAMSLATVGADGAPSVRIVLLRGCGEAGLRFFTNYDSRKSHDLAANVRAAALFYWPKLYRQVRFEGVVEKLPAAESDAYFAARPRANQVAAWASPQSQPATHDEVLARWNALSRDYEGKPVPRPPHWGGYCLRPSTIEFWIGDRARLHRRELFERAGDVWTMRELGP